MTAIRKGILERLSRPLQEARKRTASKTEC